MELLERIKKIGKPINATVLIEKKKFPNIPWKVVFLRKMVTVGQANYERLRNDNNNKRDEIKLLNAQLITLKKIINFNYKEINDLKNSTPSHCISK